ncbi:MAG TPA: response regulator transcription factor [Gaiellaceae bacterium]|nr:response regulator transcription factor [Gaiellaceae bacterium]
MVPERGTECVRPGSDTRRDGDRGPPHPRRRRRPRHPAPARSGARRGRLRRGGRRERPRRAFHDRPADLVVLDLSMPSLDGFDTLERLRDLGRVPVILLTAREGEIDKVRGFRAGADDYVVKPFGRQELLARIEAQLRRSPPPTQLENYDDGLLAIDFATRSVLYGGLPARLSPLEFRLLAALVRHRGQVLSVDQLLDHGWGTGAGVGPEQVKLYVSYLRRKLGPAPDGSPPIQTVRGFGYRYTAPAR